MAENKDLKNFNSYELMDLKLLEPEKNTFVNKICTQPKDRDGKYVKNKLKSYLISSARYYCSVLFYITFQVFSISLISGISFPFLVIEIIEIKMNFETSDGKMVSIEPLIKELSGHLMGFVEVSDKFKDPNAPIPLDKFTAAQYKIVEDFVTLVQKKDSQAIDKAKEQTKSNGQDDYVSL